MVQSLEWATFTLQSASVLLRQSSSLEIATQQLEQAVRLLKARVGTESPLTATALNNLALSLKLRGHADQALPLFMEALAIRSRVLPPITTGENESQQPHPDVVVSMHNAAECLTALGRKDEAVQLRQRIASLLDDDQSESSSSTSSA